MIHSHNMKILHDTYISLLADISMKTGFTEIRESCFTLEWMLERAPLLEKHVLECVENQVNLELDMFPISLRRLARRSLVDPSCMRFLRQLLLFCYKAEVDYTDAQLNQAFAQFEQTNRETGEFGERLKGQLPYIFDHARRLCQSVLYYMDLEDMIPSHGPGATTTPKQEWSTLYTKLEKVFPFSTWFATHDCGKSTSEQWECLNHLDSAEAKVIAVPKDSRGPRLICVHPAELIWIQQGIWRELSSAIGATRRYDCWPRGHIRFFDQDPNGLIALLSSQSGLYATLDLKEASDRISEELVRLLFGPYYAPFEACRAQTYRLPDNRTGILHCYAPMGNATTFPVQSLVFWAICVASLVRQGYSNPNRVFVFGDDLIVPSVAAEKVIYDLECFGLLVNRRKSFYQGAFRESCGVDAYSGFNVTPVRWKTRTTPSSLEDLLALSDLAMRMRIQGYEETARSLYWHLAALLKRRTLRRIRGRLTWSKLFFTNNPNHGGLAEYVFRDTLAFEKAYWHSDYQYYVTPLFRVEALTEKSVSGHRNDVLESLCSLEKTARSNVPLRLAPRRVRLKRGWTKFLIN